MKENGANNKNSNLLHRCLWHNRRILPDNTVSAVAVGATDFQFHVFVLFEIVSMKFYTHERPHQKYFTFWTKIFIPYYSYIDSLSKRLFRVTIDLIITHTICIE